MRFYPERTLPSSTRRFTNWGVGYGARFPVVHAIRGVYFGRKAFAAISGIARVPTSIAPFVTPLCRIYARRCRDLRRRFPDHRRSRPFLLISVLDDRRAAKVHSRTGEKLLAEVLRLRFARPAVDELCRLPQGTAAPASRWGTALINWSGDRAWCSPSRPQELSRSFASSVVPRRALPVQIRWCGKLPSECFPTPTGRPYLFWFESPTQGPRRKRAPSRSP